MGPFEITKAHVAGLDDVQLRALAERLLTAEARQRGIPLCGIFVGGKQTAGDGGVDASIIWTGRPQPAGWLPRRRIYLQCKAETMAAAKVTDEMCPEGEARDIFAELAATDGAYIVFTTDDPTKSGRDKRLKAMSKAVSEVPDRQRILLDFYGADQIARWANQHIGVALWLLEQAGRRLGGWRPFGDWSAPGSSDKPFLVDDTARASIGDDVVDMVAALVTIRAELRSANGVVRLVGLSGMGKTRLAEALFDDRLGDGALPKAAALYGDLGSDLSVGAARVAEELVLAGVEAVLVVDNCAAKTHGQLAEIVGRAGSRVSLLTVDYDIGGEKPAGQLVTLGGNGEVVIRALLEQRFPDLSEAERHHLAQFSGGNARIALKIAEGAGAGIDLSKLNDGELLERLFQAGRQELEPHARSCAEAAALVYAFYVEEGDHQQPEHPLLAMIAGVSVDAFYRAVATFLDWGIVQQRGPQRAVMPPPLANMLSRPFIRRSDPKTLLSHFLSASPRLLASFARRLGQLHDEPVAVRIVEGLLADGAPFGEPAILDEPRRRAFTMMSPAAPEAALAAFERSLRGPKRAELLDPKAPGRRDYPQLLVHLAHEQSLFARAMDVLLAFALADEDAKDGRQGKEHFLERFWLKLSFTLADQSTRLAYIDQLLDDPSEAVRALGVEAVDHMLDASYFSSSFNMEFGARARVVEWRPSTRKGYDDWFEAAYARAVRIAAGNSALAERAREIIAGHLRGHLDAGQGERALEAMRKTKGAGYWDAGWRSINDALHFSAAGPSASLRPAAIDLEKGLRPKTLEDSFEAFVAGEPWRLWHPSGRSHNPIRHMQRLARATGLRMARRGMDPAPFLEQAIASEGPNSVWAFGLGLAHATADITSLWRTACRIFAASSAAHPEPRMLAGILEAAARRDPALVGTWLDEALADPALARHFVTLQLAVPLDAKAMERFRQALAHGAVPLFEFSILQCGSVTKPVPADALVAFLAELYELDGGRLAALQILHMRIYGDRSDKIALDPALIALARQLVADPRTFTEQNAREDHGIDTILRFAIDGEGGAEAAVAACRALRGDGEADSYYNRDFDKVCHTLMRMHPRVVLDEIVAKDSRDGLRGRFFGGYARNDDDIDQAKIKFDETVTMDWVREDAAARAPLLAEFVPYTRREEESGLLTWSPFVRQLIAIAPEPVVVLRALERRFFSGSGSGPLSARYVRRRPLVTEMVTHDDVEVRNWARSALQGLEENIRRWDARERDHDSRFE